MRRRRGRRLLTARLLLLRRFFCGLLRCCFLRCHVISTSLRCQNVELCVNGISEFADRVHFSLLTIFVGRKMMPEIFSSSGEREDRPLRLSMDPNARQAGRARRATQGKNLICPLRPSNEHLLIVRVPGARDWHGCHSSHRFHLMLQPMLALCLLSTDFPASAASIATRRSRPVTGLLLPGRLSSSCPW